MDTFSVKMSKTSNIYEAYSIWHNATFAACCNLVLSLGQKKFLLLKLRHLQVKSEQKVFLLLDDYDEDNDDDDDGVVNLLENVI